MKLSLLVLLKNVLEIWQLQPLIIQEMPQLALGIIFARLAAMVLLFSESTILVPWFNSLLQPDPYHSLPKFNQHKPKHALSPSPLQSNHQTRPNLLILPGSQTPKPTVKQSIKTKHAIYCGSSSPTNYPPHFYLIPIHIK